MIEKHNFFKEIIVTRLAFRDIIAAGIFLGLSVGIFSSLISRVFTMESIVLLGTISFLLFCLVILWKIERYKKVSISAFFICMKKDNKILDIDRYDYNLKLYEYFESAFREDDALKMLWNSDPLSNVFKFNIAEGSTRFENTNSAKLIREATEYYFLKKLETHLSSFFNNDEVNNDNLMLFSRDDIPSVLLKNRFIELFSRGIEERAGFSCIKKNKCAHDIVSSYGVHGELYEKFELVLPKRSVVTRDKNSRIVIRTPKFNLATNFNFIGVNTVLPDKFEEYYLKLHDEDDYKIYEISINIEIYLKFSIFLSKHGDEYHAWLDSFLNSLEKDFSQEMFFDRINWEVAMTMLEISNYSINGN